MQGPRDFRLFEFRYPGLRLLFRRVGRLQQDVEAGAERPGGAVAAGRGGRGGAQPGAQPHHPRHQTGGPGRAAHLCCQPPGKLHSHVETGREGQGIAGFTVVLQ